MREISWRPRGANDRGHLIVFCGNDGSGKTTQIEILRKSLEQRGQRVFITKQPTDWYRADPYVRSYLADGGLASTAKVLALFAAADRQRHCNEVIAPAMQDGAIVICDRYIYSSLAYFPVRGISADFVASVNPDLIKPDVALYLKVPSEVLLDRLKQRDAQGRKFEERSLELISRIGKEFERLAGNLQVIDGNQPISNVANDVWKQIQKKIPLT